MNVEKRNEKRILREKVLLTREKFDKTYIDEATKDIIGQLMKTSAYENSKIIFTYIDFQNEVETKDFIETSLACGKRICVPLCKKEGQMTAREIFSLDDLKINSFGILEPLEASPIIAPSEIDLCIVPCVCVNKEGYRLGYGGGYYDRFLPETNAIQVLLCYKDFVYQEIPLETHDVKIHILIYNH